MTKNKVDIAEATKAHKYTDYKGKRYYFCCGDCSSMFKKNPGKYAKYGMAIPKAKKS
jgi:YHS domain-containing protein